MFQRCVENVETTLDRNTVTIVAAFPPNSVFQPPATVPYQAFDGETKKITSKESLVGL